MTESLSETMSKPTYQSSLRLKSGGTVHVTALADGEILFDVQNENGDLITANPTGAEAGEMAAMLEAAQRATWRGRA